MADDEVVFDEAEAAAAPSEDDVDIELEADVAVVAVVCAVELLFAAAISLAKRWRSS